MKTEAMDKRFALISSYAEILYPFKKKQLATGRYGFALSAPGERDSYGGGEYTEDITAVIRRVVFDGWKVRAATIDDSENQRSGSVKQGGKAIVGHWVAPELRYLVEGASLPPRALPEN